MEVHQIKNEIVMLTLSEVFEIHEKPGFLTFALRTGALSIFARHLMIQTKVIVTNLVMVPASIKVK